MTTKPQSTELTAPERVTLWICCHCQTPRMIGLSVCERCGKRLHDVVEYQRTPASAAPVVDNETLDLFSKLALIGKRFEQSTTHAEVAALVWACRALIDDDAEVAPFFTHEAQDCQMVYGAALNLYFKHAQRVLGRSPHTAEVDEIETGFCNPWIAEKKAERLDKGRILLTEICTAAATAESVCIGCLASRHGVGRCLIHEPKANEEAR